MAKEYRSDVRRNNEIVAMLELSGDKSPDMPLRQRLLTVSKPKLGGKKRKTSNSGGTGKAARRLKRKYLSVNSRKGV